MSEAAKFALAAAYAFMGGCFAGSMYSATRFDLFAWIGFAFLLLFAAALIGALVRRV